MTTPEQWIRNTVNDYGRQDCLAAFECTEEELDAAINGDKAAVYQLSIQRGKAALATLKAMAEVRKAATRKDGRPTARLTTDEAKAVVDLVHTEGAPGFCYRKGLTEASLGKAVLGMPVALHTLAALRSALDNGSE